MKHTFAAALLLALAIFGLQAGPARAAATQVLAGSRFESLAKPVSAAVRLKGDAALVQSYPIPDQIVPAGRISLAVQSAIVTPYYVNVPVEIDLNGHFLRQIFVGYRVQRYVQTAVATHDLLPGAVLTAADLKLARMVYLGQRTNGTDVLVGRRVISAIRAGAPITIEGTEIDQIVKAGNTVTLIVDNDGVRVAADVVARTSGGLGQHVSLYNPLTNKLLTGTVVGPDRVELNLSGETL
ncbi:MAG TPA: flagellar basal body P-ring formation chaperone FlgA [Alphaproteobacteria bacterium]|nr:flagellar basal body P-ring formation chaperone FlgA [Alphaproteobacteria bacterium]